MAYRDDCEAFVRRRAQDEAEAALAVAFREAERARRTRAYTSGIGALIVSLVAIRAWPSAPPPSKPAAVEVVVRPKDLVAERAAAERRACLRWAVHSYLKVTHTLQRNVAGDTGPQITLDEIARRCASLSSQPLPELP